MVPDYLVNHHMLKVKQEGIKIDILVGLVSEIIMKYHWIVGILACKFLETGSQKI